MTAAVLPLENRVWVLRYFDSSGASLKNRLITGTRADAVRAWKMELARSQAHLRVDLHPLGEAIQSARGEIQMRAVP